MGWDGQTETFRRHANIFFICNTKSLVSPVPYFNWKIKHCFCPVKLLKAFLYFVYLTEKYLVLSFFQGVILEKNLAFW